MIDWLKNVFFFHFSLFEFEFDWTGISEINLFHIAVPKFNGSLLYLSVDRWQLDPKSIDNIIQRIEENDENASTERLVSLRDELMEAPSFELDWDVFFIRQFLGRNDG